MSGVRPTHDSDPLDQSKIDRIAEEFTAAIRRGEHPAIGDYLARYPSGADQLQSLLASIAMIEGLKDDSHTAPQPETPTIRQLDDYTILREIGRGGMGVVFEAIHQSLGRRVAVKVLASGLLGDTKHLVRFRREARAAARLRHPNIVSVFGVGQADQHHYYVMDLIDGMSLKEWLSGNTGKGGKESPTRTLAATETESDLLISSADQPATHNSTVGRQRFLPDNNDSPEFFRWVTRMVATICDALQYAHNQGVLHRDLKPANLLIDARGEVWIADFGLAKLAEQQAMTATGDVVGTPQYMPPESYEGQYDQRSETYGIGLLLYELLTRRPAIEGKNTADVIRNAVEGIKTSPRKLNAKIPRDLETIVVKALSRDSGARYATAGDLRDDLRCVLEGHPISARRLGVWERGARWARREPKVATLTCVTFLSLLALALVSAVGYVRTSSALASEQRTLKEKLGALTTADQQRRRAEDNLQIALSAFNKIMLDITARGIEPDAEFVGEIAETTSPNVTPADAELLKSLLGFFDKLAATNSEDLLAESAQAGRLAGDIYQRLGNLPQADRAYSDALARYRNLSQQDPDELAALSAQAAIMNELTLIAGVRGMIPRATQIFESSLKLFEQSAALRTSTEGRFQYARAHRIFSTLGARSGLDQIRGLPGIAFKFRLGQDLRACEQAIETLQELVADFPDELRFDAELGRAWRDNAKVLTRTRMRLESEHAIRRSVDIFESLLAQHPESSAIKYELAKTLSTTEALGINSLLRTMRANELSSSLLEESPTLAHYQALKARTLTALASHQIRHNRATAAEENLTEAVAIYESLISEMPELMVYRTQRMTTLESLADLKLKSGEQRAASNYLQQALRSLPPPGRLLDNSRVARSQQQRIRARLNRLRDANRSEN